VIELTLGHRFSINEFRSPYMQRQLIFRNSRPVGHLSFAFGGKCHLWLQNYVGYHSDNFVLTFDTPEIALARAKEILADWDNNPERPTWVC
jgi:hypothetical protein